MAKLFGLEIPAGLEDLWNLIFKPQTEFYPEAIFGKAAIKRKSGYGALAARSYFVMWQSLYNGFSQGRRDLWTSYWLTLPFGSHEGANGWPGSGYSAFVFVNANRMRLHLSLLLDPPVENFIYNGDFSLGTDGWNPIVGWNLSGGNAHIANAGYSKYFESSSSKAFEIIYLRSYKIEFDCTLSGANLLLHILGVISGWSLFQDIIVPMSGHYSRTFTVTHPDSAGRFYLGAYYGATATIDNIVLTKL